MALRSILYFRFFETTFAQVFPTIKGPSLTALDLPISLRPGTHRAFYLLANSPIGLLRIFLQPVYLLSNTNPERKEAMSLGGLCGQTPYPPYPEGVCYTTYNDESLEPIAKCCGTAPVVPFWNSFACIVYCPVVPGGLDMDELNSCLASVTGSAGCQGTSDGGPVAPDSVIIQARREAENNKDICRICRDKPKSLSGSATGSSEIATETSGTLGATGTSDEGSNPTTPTEASPGESANTPGAGGNFRPSKVVLGVAMILGFGYVVNV